MSHAIANISRPSLPRLDRRSRNGAVIGQSCLSPIHPIPHLLPLATISAELSPHELSLFTRAAWRDVLVSSLPCVSCESATCSVPCRRSSCKRQTSSFHPHPRSDDSACLQSPASPLPRIPRSHRRSRDSAVIGQSCLHSPAKIVVKRQSQPTGSSLSALKPRQIARKRRGRTVLLAAAYCAKDPRAALNR